MCQSSAYLEKDGNEELLLEDVEVVEPREGNVYLRTILGDEKTVPGEIAKIDFVGHKIVLTPTKA